MIKCVVVGRPTIDSQIAGPPPPPPPFSTPFFCSGVKSAFLNLFCLCKRERITTTTSNIPGTIHPHNNNTDGTGSHIFHLVDILGVESITWTLGDAHSFGNIRHCNINNIIIYQEAPTLPKHSPNFYFEQTARGQEEGKKKGGGGSGGHRGEGKRACGTMNFCCDT